MELSRGRLAAAVVARCRNDHIEPPAPGQVGRLVGKAVKEFEARFCRSMLDRLSRATRSRLEDLISGDATDEEADGDGAVVGGGDREPSPGPAPSRHPSPSRPALPSS